MRWLGVACVFVVAQLSATGCEDWFRDQVIKNLPDIVPDIGGDGAGGIDLTAGVALGGACVKDDKGYDDCRFGLKCIDGECRAVGDTPQNDLCILSDECAEGLFCSIKGLCEPSGQGDVNAPCTSAAECKKGLYCMSLGFAGSCAEAGTGDIGDACEDNSGCLGGLLCGADGACTAGSITFGLRPWGGVTCSAQADDDGPPRVYFEIPPAGGGDEFFRLPFPNDIRVRNHKIDLAGFPTPGPGIIGFDPIDRVVDAIEMHQKGWSTVPTVYLRFSHGVSFESITAKGESPTLRFLAITPDQPGYGSGVSFGWFVTDGGGKYICPRYLAARPSWSAPLRPATTYAVILFEGLESADGTPLVADDDFVAMMAQSAPADPTTAAAWEAYAPLRAYLDEQGIVRSSVVAAAVFTTQPTQELLPRLRALAQDIPAPAPKQITLCDGGATSPCDDGLSGEDHVRGCLESAGEVWELHMRVPIPKVQKGTRPYPKVADGGYLELGGGGDPVLQGNEDVCVSLTIPKDVTMPEAGWPLGIYGHGTGGTFRSSVSTGKRLASIDVGGSTVGAALVGWDGPMHGDRRNSELDPEVLFYNFANPQAALGNLYQGAMDVFVLVRTFKDLTIGAADSPTGEPIRFDASKLFHVGHSQGATTGPLASPYEADIRANVWSGAGAGLVLSLLSKSEPVDIKAGVAVALQEFTDQGFNEDQINDKHPALGIIQGLFDPVDPLNHAKLQVLTPLDEVGAQHVLHVYGIDDSYTPPATIETFAKLLGLEHVLPAVKEVDGLVQVAAPVTGNKRAETITAGMVQAQPDGYDGHYVMSRNPGAIKQLQQFIGTFIINGVPTIVGPN